MNPDTPQTTPRHPLVIDRETGKARLATQTDIHRMEAICVHYNAIIRDFAEKLRMAKYHEDRLETVYGR